MTNSSDDVEKNYFRCLRCRRSVLNRKFCPENFWLTSSCDFTNLLISEKCTWLYDENFFFPFSEVVCVWIVLILHRNVPQNVSQLIEAKFFGALSSFFIFWHVKTSKTAIFQLLCRKYRFFDFFDVWKVKKRSRFGNLYYRSIENTV